MRIVDIKKDKYNLHFIKTNKFKTTLVKVIFSNNLKKEELTIRNLLLNNLLFSSAKYNTLRKMAIKKDDLFGIDLYSKTYKRGSLALSEISLTALSDKYTEKGSLKKGLEFMFDIINNPNTKDNKFDDVAFKINYDRLKTSIINEEDDPMFCAYKGFKEMIGNDKIYGTSSLGTIKDLEKITPSSLYNYYKKFLSENQIDIYVVGNFNEKEIEKVFENNINWTNRNSSYQNKIGNYEKDFSCKEIESKFNQSKIIMGGNINNLTEHEKLYDGIIYNIILGNSPNSKLFQNVREKYSLAYSISSSINRLEGSFFIYAGISYDNVDKTKQEIYKQIEDMKQGKFLKKDVKDAKQAILSIMKEIDEYPGSMLDHYMNYLYFGNEKLVIQKEEINKITKEDIVRVANKINIDTIFVLKEETNEKNKSK